MKGTNYMLCARPVEGYPMSIVWMLDVDSMVAGRVHTTMRNDSITWDDICILILELRSYIESGKARLPQ